MLQFILKRIFLFIPTLLIVSAIVFYLSQLTVGDPIEIYMSSSAELTQAISETQYKEEARTLGLDKPVFYAAITSIAYPDTLYKIIKKDERTTVQKLIAQYGNAEAVLNYFNKIKNAINAFPTEGGINDLKLLLIQSDEAQIASYFNNLKNLTIQNIDFQKDMQQIENSYFNLKNTATPYKCYIPTVHWYGLDNQYHHWLTGILKGNFGISYKTGQPVLSKIITPLSITLTLTLLALFFSYLLAIPFGIFMAMNADTRKAKWLMRTQFFMFSLPQFWVATLAIVFLTTPQYGLKIFPSAGLADVSADASLLEWLIANAGRLILPIFCMIIHPTAELSRQIQSNITDVMRLDYIRTARAKGLTWSVVYRKHAFRNAIFPLITMLGQLFAAGMGGAVIIEYIFNIHGLGLTSLEALNERDWPVVFALVLLSSMAVLIGHLITDILYHIFNPKSNLSI